MSEAPPPFVEYPRQFPGQSSKEQVRGAAEAYKLSNNAARIYFLCIALSAGTRAMAQSSTDTATLFLIANFVVILVFAFFAAKASMAAANVLGSNPTVAALITVLLVCVPCGALIVLISQQQRLNKIFKAAGIKVGWKGPDAAAIESYINDPNIP